MIREHFISADQVLHWLTWAQIQWLISMKSSADNTWSSDGELKVVGNANFFVFTITTSCVVRPFSHLLQGIILVYTEILTPFINWIEPRRSMKSSSTLCSSSLRWIQAMKNTSINWTQSFMWKSICVRLSWKSPQVNVTVPTLCVGDHDAYGFAANNFGLYHNPTDGLFQWVFFDTDISWGLDSKPNLDLGTINVYRYDE